MKTAIAGAILGTGLFIVGFIYHDVRFDEFRETESIRIGRTDAGHTAVMYESSYQEEYAYVIGLTGAAILGASVKHLWDNRKDNKPSKTDQAYSKFRMTLDLLVGTGFVIGGINAHDKSWERDSPRWSQHYRTKEWEMYQRAANMEEHGGYLLGATGAFWLASSVKHAWDTRRAENGLDRAYRDLRIKLHLYH